MTSHLLLLLAVAVFGNAAMAQQPNKARHLNIVCSINQHSTAHCGAGTGPEYVVYSPGDTVSLLCYTMGPTPLPLLWKDSVEGIQRLPLPQYQSVDRYVSYSKVTLPALGVEHSGIKYECVPRVNDDADIDNSNENIAPGTLGDSHVNRKTDTDINKDVNTSTKGETGVKTATDRSLSGREGASVTLMLRGSPAHRRMDTGTGRVSALNDGLNDYAVVNLFGRSTVVSFKIDSRTLFVFWSVLAIFWAVTIILFLIAKFTRIRTKKHVTRLYQTAESSNYPNSRTIEQSNLNYSSIRKSAGKSKITAPLWTELQPSSPATCNTEERLLLNSSHSAEGSMPVVMTQGMRNVLIVATSSGYLLPPLPPGQTTSDKQRFPAYRHELQY